MVDLNRQQYNYKILSKLRKDFPEFSNLYEEIEECIRLIPNQRFSQIICNYIFPDYRSEDIEFMKILFPNTKDPFYEESSVTFNRIYGCR